MRRQFLSSSGSYLQRVAYWYRLPTWAVVTFYSATALSWLMSVTVAVVAICLALRAPADPFAMMATRIEAAGHRVSSSVSELLAWAFVFFVLPPLLAFLYRNTLPKR